MPNTLAHIGVQIPLTRMGFQKVPVQWILLGCIIPDIPWILQRTLLLIPGIDPVNLRLYAVTQASFLFCCILSLLFALFTRRTGAVFLILAASSLLHLLLDACQTKWGNGINLLVPFSWKTMNFAFFWPEDITTLLLTAMGIALLIYYWPKAVKDDLFLQKPGKTKTILLVITIIFYLATPFLFIKDAFNADLHFSKTIASKSEQSGKPVEIDRGRYNSVTKTIGMYADKAIPINNPPKIPSGSLSIKGTFDGKNSITISEFHRHTGYRNYASYAGLLLVFLLWSHSALKMIGNSRKTRSGQGDTHYPLT